MSHLTLPEQIAGMVMSEIVHRNEIARRENDEVIDLDIESVWEVVEITVEKAVHHILTLDNDGSALVAIARATPKVMEECRMGKKIQAIKELRSVSKAGLKEAKEAIDIIWDEDGISPSGAPL